MKITNNASDNLARKSRKTKSFYVLVLALFLFQSVESHAAEPLAVFLPRQEDFTLLWWAEGPPYYLEMKTPPPSNTLCFQTGTWGLALDAKSVRGLHLGRFPKRLTIEDSLGSNHQAAIDKLPAPKWELNVFANGKKYTCVGRIEEPNDKFFYPVRFVESGRVFQRVVIEGLKFTDDKGQEFPHPGRLEISAWADRLALRLEFASKEKMPEGKMELIVDDKHASARLDKESHVLLDVFGADSLPRPVVKADAALKGKFDESLGCHVFALPEARWSNAKKTYYPEEHLDRLDRWRLTLRNDAEKETVARLMFIQKDYLPYITGFVPMMCDSDGTPTAIPVQISKNWHRHPEKSIPHEGPWFHGCSAVRLPPKSQREFTFTMTYARWGGVPTASHAQLSLVGWAHNQFWDQAALGSFGESICYEPGRIQRRCFIDDLRPFLLSSKPKGEKYTWTWNEGGGDFLVYYDAKDQYQGFRGTRTDYRAYGPNLTDVTYAETTVDGCISARMNASISRSDDYLRVFHRFRYDVLKPTQFTRLALYQMNSDFYNENQFKKLAIGNLTGLVEEWEPKKGNNEYERKSVPLPGEQPWISAHDVIRDESSDNKGAAAARSLVIRSWKATLGGKPANTPHLSVFQRKINDKHRTILELSLPPKMTSLQPGDFIEGEVELVLLPMATEDYYGPDETLRDVLRKHANTWNMVHREAVGNALKPAMQRGTLVRNYPLVVAVDGDQQAEMKVQGGVGYVPVTFTGLTRHRGYELSLDGKRVDQSIHGNDFWQTNYDSSTEKWRITYNVRLSNSPEKGHILRFGPAK